MQARVDWVLIIFGTQVIKKRRPVRSVFPDYLSVSYDYVQNNQPVTELSFSVSPITKHQIFCTKLRKYSPTSYNTTFLKAPFLPQLWTRKSENTKASVFSKALVFKINILKFIWSKPNNIYY